jgi:hypothetical protein
MHCREHTNGTMLIKCATGNDQRDLHPARRSKRSADGRFGWCHSISRHFALDCLPLVRHPVRCSPWPRLLDVRRDSRTVVAHYRTYPAWLWCIGKEQCSSRSSAVVLIFTVDHLLPWSHSLGSRVGWIWRRPRIPSIRHRHLCYSGGLANTSFLCRDRSDRTIPRLHISLLRGFQSLDTWLGTSMVLDLPICLDLRSRCLDCCFLDRTRPDLRFDHSPNRSCSTYASIGGSRHGDTRERGSRST